MKPGIVLTIIAIVLLALGAADATDKPGPFVFMYGLQGPDAADRAVQMGLNTLYLQLTADDLSNLSSVRSQIGEAAAHNLSVIVALPTVPPIPYRVSLSNREYVASTRDLITRALSALNEEPGLTAWATGDYLEDSISYTPAEFQQYLRQHYGTLEELNRAWNCAYTNWMQISIDAAQAADDDLPFGVGRPSVDVAKYQHQTFHDVMAFWAEQIRALDPDRLLFTGRLCLYRSLVAVPDEYDVVVPAASPEILEPDIDSHNVQAVDMARRGGRFAVVPALSIPVPPDPLFAQRPLRRWIAQAGLHGAAGVALEDWQRIASLARPDVVTEYLSEDLAAGAYGATFRAEPRPRAAFLYEPYGEGLALGQIPVYGYIPGFSEGEPSNLFAAFRQGSKFGLVDYLTVHDLLGQQADLHRYSFIAAPLAVDLPLVCRQQLEEYVEEGGVLISDLGAGMYQTGAWDELPVDLAQLFGILAIGQIQERVTDMSIGVACRHFPSLPPPLETAGSFTLVRRTVRHAGQTQVRRQTGTPQQRRPYTLSGPVAYVAIGPGALPWAVSQVIWEKSIPYYGGIIVNDYGLGVGIFATSRLWANWRPDDPVYMGFHGDLWARRADYTLLQAGLWPQKVQIAGSTDEMYLLNISSKPVVASVMARGADSRLYEGALCQFSAAARQPSGKRSGAALLTVDLSPIEVTALTARPVQIQPYSGEVSGRLLQYSGERVKFEVAGPGTRLLRGISGGMELAPGRPTAMRVTIASGLYPVEPLSWHGVEIKAGFQRDSTKQVQADHNGKLRFDVSGQRATVEVSAGSPA